MKNQLRYPPHLTGLTEDEVLASRQIHGSNLLDIRKRNTLLRLFLDILQEPMLLLLVAISVIYFLLQQYGEAYFMLFAIVIVSGISFYQDNRSRKALKALEQINAPLSYVIRDGETKRIPTQEIVPGDLVMAEEGSTINADGIIMHSHDFSVNESIITGESVPVYKSADTEDRLVMSGTQVSSGMVIYQVKTTGKATRLGQIGASLADISKEPTPLQHQITVFVRQMAIAGVIVFLLIWIFNFSKSGDVLNSLLKGLTLAMSILPEEIPVAFTTFMALGSRRMMMEGIIVKNMRTVEALGSATVICVDKTGTITENRMELRGVYVYSTRTFYNPSSYDQPAASLVIETSMWASEPVPFDAMEKALHAVYEKFATTDLRDQYRMVEEYPLSGKPPMMTHVYENQDGNRIIAAKGATETILRVCQLTEEEKADMHNTLSAYSRKGYRILGVARADDLPDPLPDSQEAIPFQLIGFVFFLDPPKPNIKTTFEQFLHAGLQVKIVTGDQAGTTGAIAREAGLELPDEPVDGDQLMSMTPADRTNTILQRTVFTRMFPEAKLEMVEELKKQDQIVAMVGDGVNDAPALQAAHIGIAMGKKGTEIAKNAAALVLVQDDLSKMIDAIATGRRIYGNLKKAIQYIISIHIPILLTVSLPLFLGWIYPDIFTPVHVIFLELIMGPTCSIIYENEPVEKNVMQMPPRKMTDTFLNWKEMGWSILQGLMITAGVLWAYQLAVHAGKSEAETRAFVFTTLVMANILLTLVNRSFYFSLWESLKFKNRLIPLIILLTLSMLVLILYVPAFAVFFHVAPLDVNGVVVCAGLSGVSVLWFEGVKWWRRQ
jgi:Ca2+-transporting ATPase